MPPTLAVEVMFNPDFYPTPPEVAAPPHLIMQ
jgi:hypothetical protein